MKKLQLLSMIVLIALGTNAQDFKKVQTAMLLNKLDDAKTEIDKLAAEPKAQAKAETYYYKSRVYAALIKDPVASKKYPNLVTDADAAVQKYWRWIRDLHKSKKRALMLFSIYIHMDLTMVSALLMAKVGILPVFILE
jgi:hypothetical protein